MASPGSIPLDVGAADLMTCGVDAGAVEGVREVFVIASAQARTRKVFVPANYGGGLVCKCNVRASAATAGNVVITAECDAKTPGSADNWTAASFDTADSSGAITVPDAATKGFQVPITCAHSDGAAIGDELWVRLTVTGSATGNLYLLDAWLEYTIA